jgi:Ca2+:H+ antiporter
MPAGSVRGQSTLKRRTTAIQSSAASRGPAEDDDLLGDSQIIEPTREELPPPPHPTEEVEEREPEIPSDDDDDDEEEEDDGNISDAESFTLKDRQEAINVTHPFGIRVWKPALYKKGRSVQKAAEDEIHSSPGLNVTGWLKFFNYLWTIVFGWWLAAICLFGSLLCLIFGIVSRDSLEYAHVLFGFSRYLFYPFGKFIKLLHEEQYAVEDEGEGRSISEYEQWQSGDLEEGRLLFGPMDRNLIGRRRSEASADEHQSLLGRVTRGLPEHHENAGPKTRFFGRGKWNIGRVLFFAYFHLVITPFLLTVSALCWFFVFSIPMGKVTWMLYDHMRRHPLALVFHAEMSDIRYPGEPPSSILLCTYRAVGSRYWKYTIDGTNIFLFNLLGVVVFTIFDYFVLYEMLGLKIVLTIQGLIFVLGLLSIIPLAYFIGQAVASISAQSSMGVGATVNAFFSTVVEVFLYCVALKQGKAALVEGSIIGSIFAGVLFLPGLSMCFGALKRKTQRFNVKSAGVTSTMMLFAVIATFGPTLFYQIYGSHELKCHDCIPDPSPERDCRRCFFSQTPTMYDKFFGEAVRPFIYFCAATLFLSYVIGLLFTLRTHAAIIWSTDAEEKRGTDATPSQVTSALILHDSPEMLSRQPTVGSIIPTQSNLPESQLYQRLIGTPRTTGLSEISTVRGRTTDIRNMKSPKITSPRVKDLDVPGLNLESLSEAENQALSKHVADLAASAAAAVARDVGRHHQRKTSYIASPQIKPTDAARLVPPKPAPPTEADAAMNPEAPAAAQDTGGGHDAPNWSKTKSAVVLLTATLAYAVIAEILVSTVDAVLESFAVDEKFLGITLFALVPNTTEFLNAISFAMNGNIALSMEIGSAYALQVCLLQIPCLVLFSAFSGQYIDPASIGDHTFCKYTPSLIFHTANTSQQ